MQDFLKFASGDITFSLYTAASGISTLPFRLFEKGKKPDTILL